MKALGIEIDGNTAIFCVVEKKDEAYHDVTGDSKKFELDDDEDSVKLRRFVDIMHSYLGSHDLDHIYVIRRGRTGKFAASPISFKVEGLIQMYSKKNVQFVPQATLNTYFKKNTLPFTPKYIYQSKAAQLAYYVLNK